jgi:hypothetical protein
MAKEATMFKVIGPGLVLAIGAGLYYWWHEHHDGDLGSARSEIEGTARELRDKVEHS